MPSFRVESIYGAALAKLILDHSDFELVTPDQEQIKLLGVEKKIASFDVQIADLEDHSGIILKGDALAAKKIVTLLQEHLEDVFVQRHGLQAEAIFNARVKHVNPRKKLAIVSLGNNKDGIIFTSGLERGDEIIVQVKELTTEEEKLPLVSETIHLSGEYVVLEKGEDFVRVSRKIKGDDRERLHEIGKRIKPYGFGVILRTSALEASIDDLEAEAEKLVEIWEKIEREADRIGRPGLIYSGQHVVHLSLSYLSKKRLEEIRSSLAPTFPDYYVLKSYSRNTNFTVSVLNRLLDLVPLETLSDALRATLFEEAYVHQHYLRAFLKTPDYNIETFGLGHITSAGDMFETEREVSLRESEELNDYGVKSGYKVITKTGIGSLLIDERFLSPGNSVVYRRIKITAPIDYSYRGKLQAHWLGIEVHQTAEDLWIAEPDALDMWIDDNRVSLIMVEKLRQVAESVKKQLSSDESTVINYTYHDYNKL